MSNGSVPVTDDSGDDEGIRRQIGEEDDGANDRDLVAVFLGSVGFVAQRASPNTPHFCQ